MVSRLSHVLVYSAFVLTALVTGTHAQPVDCSNADNLCTGDPCITGKLDIAPPCVVDFSPRTLIIGNKMTILNVGTVQLTAGTIEVNGAINAKPAAAGVDISLIAAGNISVFKKINVRGPGSITLNAGGDIDLQGLLKAASNGVPGGTVTAQAGGTLTASKLIRVRGHRGSTAGGQATLSAPGGITLLRGVDARGNPGGMIAISSTAGDVVIERAVRANGIRGVGGSVDVAAAGQVVSGRRGRFFTSGRMSGGSLTVDGDTGVNLEGPIRALGRLGGSVGGMIIIASTSGDVAIARVDADGKAVGGSLDVSSPNGNVILNKAIRLRGRAGGGGSLDVEAGGSVTVDKAVRIDGATTGGEMRFAANGGNLTLGTNNGTKFWADAPVGGVIEGQASGNLTARGDYRAAVGGCIGLSAGGTLDTTMATFDVPYTASCP